MSRFEKYIDEMCGKSHDKKKKKKVAEADSNLAKRLVDQWKKIAGEQVKIEMIGGAFYGFGSELATLRLYMKYSNKGKNNPGDKFDVGFSKNLKKHYFRMDV